MGASCDWDGTRFTLKSTATGAAASLGYAETATGGTDVSAMAGLTAALAETPIAGIDAETPAECAAELADKSGEWYGLTFAASTMPTDDQSLDVAAFIEATLAQVRATATRFDRELGPELTKTLRESTATLERARALLSDRSPLYVETQRMLQEVSSAARSMRLLTDYLERHPEALLQGKGRGR
ncbi:MAG: DUF3383 family protein [Sphingobacteriia bacterium]|nr:DUF3383 family protein [Sphingobacteriia bacterium]